MQKGEGIFSPSLFCFEKELLPKGSDTEFPILTQVEVEEIQVKHVVDSGPQGFAVKLSFFGSFDNKSPCFRNDLCGNKVHFFSAFPGFPIKEATAPVFFLFGNFAIGAPVDGIYAIYIFFACEHRLDLAVSL